MLLTCPDCLQPHIRSIRHDYDTGIYDFECSVCPARWTYDPHGQCAYQGRRICETCPYLDEIEKMCDLDCRRCEDRGYCPCSVAHTANKVSVASTALESHCSVVASDAACTTRANAAPCSAAVTDNVGTVGEAERGRVHDSGSGRNTEGRG